MEEFNYGRIEKRQGDKKMNYEKIYKLYIRSAFSDEDVEFIDKANQEHLAKLEMIRLGRLNLSDFN